MQHSLDFGLPSLESYVAVGSVRNYTVEVCAVSKIDTFIEKWHYSGNVNGLKIDFCFRLKDIQGKTIGAIIYGGIAMAGVWKKYAEKESDIIELRRLCCIDNTPKNTESFFIGHTLRWLKKNTQIKTVISYADETQGHSGVIYKASNFKHMGVTQKGRVIIYQGKQYHDKTIRTKNNGKIKPYGQRIANALSEGEAYYLDTLEKHIYLYQLKK